ncbi:MAG TPA: M23 family metallopeptidase [Geopsychrobacteraceae bacterium]|nr:M23 family metallopeptidase [Geopsychrobacteraceae bacterium]
MKLLDKTYPEICSDRLLWAGLLLLLLLGGCVRGGVYHRVEPGQTLYRISKAYNLDEIYLARVNGVTDPTQLQVGTNLYIPGATSARKISTAPQNDQGTKAVTPALKTQSKPKPVTTIIKKASKPKPVVLKPQPPPSSNKIELLWPLKGKVIRSFGSAAKGGGKGIEIATRENSAVKVAAAGKVIYSGDGVKGYGHLIIVQHKSDFYTVYGFNSRNLVAQGDFVSQGEKIALSGTPPGGGEPRLHFEVRKKKIAVNPILHLP